MMRTTKVIAAILIVIMVSTVAVGLYMRLSRSGEILGYLEEYPLIIQPSPGSDGLVRTWITLINNTMNDIPIAVYNRVNSQLDYVLHFSFWYTGNGVNITDFNVTFRQITLDGLNPLISLVFPNPVSDSWVSATTGNLTIEPLQTTNFMLSIFFIFTWIWEGQGWYKLDFEALESG